LEQLGLQAQRLHQQKKPVGGDNPGFAPVHRGDCGRTAIAAENGEIAEDLTRSANP
jgi:hypothetical protein